MRRLFLTCLAWMALAGAAAAEKTAYQCFIRGTSERQWIQPLIFIALDRAIDRVVVSDASILGFNDGVPVEGALIKDNKARLTVSWQLQMRSASNQRVDMAYRATFLKSTGKVNVTARPLGREGLFNRSGTCTVTKLSG
ncbi:hypothetical protein [Mameliella sediminis]|uniref:hypothetical protein n=1 Tax=Mameliella sediminis TaxID=2836866 RepID=UPI001C451448|nr:hypothetical protein [Mameliella sediminis]MBV7392679.1 hypothetical protein [Mameliella sediminis]MBY6114840.1 hypothetical protein [Antarctobacter heliothermus]MBY6144413.1 hypothetical protein [Mameliella alba]MCA0954462.1 hypothetical protein [Mameliella alba]